VVIAMLWEELREEEFASAIEKSSKLCVLPIGCTEMHGQHLPVGTDSFEVTHVCVEASKREEVVVFPTIRFGNVPFLTSWRGSVRLTVELMQQLLKELCSEIARNGFKKILIVNGHGGNHALLGNFVSSTQHDMKDYVVLYRSDFEYGIYSLAADLREDKEFPALTKEDVDNILDFTANNGIMGHGGVDETSTTMAIRPDLVKLDRMYQVDGMPTHLSDYLRPAGVHNSAASFWYVEQPNHYRGSHPEWANERIGNVLFERRIEMQAEACRLLKMDDRILQWNDERNAKWF
jgi:creatinine amidohydrolase